MYDHFWRTWISIPFSDLIQLNMMELSLGMVCYDVDSYATHLPDDGVILRTRRCNQEPQLC